MIKIVPGGKTDLYEGVVNTGDDNDLDFMIAYDCLRDFQRRLPNCLWRKSYAICKKATRTNERAYDQYTHKFVVFLYTSSSEKLKWKNSW